MFVAKSAEGGESRKLLPLKRQQMAFENIYLKAQEGMKAQVRPHSNEITLNFVIAVPL